MAKSASKAPANTQMMVIVHSALGRDLARARKVLAAAPLADAQRKALAVQLRWMMQFLHHHHVSEDVGLFPLVRSRTVDADELLEVMEAEHQAIGPGLRAIQEESVRFELGDEAGQPAQLISAIDLLESALIP
ncbi:MAG: hemerythrin domain-containing protein, partial [Actinomycetota bacterium]|nr:hemerythrin domain-containing protein [Actinomycetota bacterium]